MDIILRKPNIGDTFSDCLIHEEMMRRSLSNFSRAYMINRRSINFGRPVKFEVNGAEDVVVDIFGAYDYSKCEIVRHLPIVDELGSMRFEPIREGSWEYADESEWIILGENGVYAYTEVEFIN